MNVRFVLIELMCGEGNFQDYLDVCPNGYGVIMTTDQLICNAMSLSLAERVSLARALWESIDAELVEADERSAAPEAPQRSEDLSSDNVRGENHEEVAEAVRQTLECNVIAA